jgi:hypothetical protein
MKGFRPRQPPAATAEAETAAFQTQAIEMVNMDKDIFTETYDTDDHGASKPKKAPEGGMKNYFVRTWSHQKPTANVEHLAGLFVRNQARRSPHYTMLYQFHRLGRHCAVDERSLWYLIHTTAHIGANGV